MIAQRRPIPSPSPLAADRLNYRHLFYFLTVVRHGGMRAAARELGVYQATVSVQIVALERALGGPLFDRGSRPWRLTESGRLVFGYAEEIFGLGQELLLALRGSADQSERPLTVGIDTGLSRRLAARLLSALTNSDSAPPVQLVCRSGPAETLLADLRRAELDLLLTATPPELGNRSRLEAQLLGECGLSFLAPRELAGALAGRFPQCLDRLPIWLPPLGSPRRTALDCWFVAQRIRPQVRGQCADESLLESLAINGASVVVVAGLLEDELCRSGELRAVGRVSSLRESIYAVLSRRRRVPGLASLQLAARQLFVSLQAAV